MEAPAAAILVMFIGSIAYAATVVAYVYDAERRFPVAFGLLHVGSLLMVCGGLVWVLVLLWGACLAL